MYALKNRVQLIGNIGQKPEIKVSLKGLRTARFMLAINESYKNSKGERVKDTQWHSLLVTGRLVDVVERVLEKGMEVAVEGRLVNRTFIDKHEVKRTLTEIQVSEILLLGNKEGSLVEEPFLEYGLVLKSNALSKGCLSAEMNLLKPALVAHFN